jgi:hypothetical protein
LEDGTHNADYQTGGGITEKLLTDLVSSFLYFPKILSNTGVMISVMTV